MKKRRWLNWRHGVAKVLLASTCVFTARYLMNYNWYNRTLEQLLWLVFSLFQICSAADMRKVTIIYSFLCSFLFLFCFFFCCCQYQPSVTAHICTFHKLFNQVQTSITVHVHGFQSSKEIKTTTATTTTKHKINKSLSVSFLSSANSCLHTFNQRRKILIQTHLSFGNRLSK